MQDVEKAKKISVIGEDMREELIQVATVCIAWIENLDNNKK